MKKLFTVAAIVLAFTSLSYAGQRDTTQANQAPDLFEGMPRFSINNMFAYSEGKGIVAQCPIKRYKSDTTKYVWNEKGFDVQVKIIHIPHNGYPGFDYADQTEVIPFNLKEKMSPQKGAGYFVDGIPGEWISDPSNSKLQVYRYIAYPAPVTISMKSVIEDYNTNKFMTGWKFDGKDDYFVRHDVALRPKS